MNIKIWLAAFCLPFSPIAQLASDQIKSDKIGAVQSHPDNKQAFSSQQISGGLRCLKLYDSIQTDIETPDKVSQCLTESREQSRGLCDQGWLPDIAPESET